MAKVDYDPSKLVKVDISKVVENGYNPKEKDTPEYRDIVTSIKTNGLRGAIVVREHPHTPGYYMIIDGQQRHTAATELGYTEVWVYNEGVVEDKEAKELTVWWQQQVPFRRDLEAMLISSMVDEFGMENLNLPYSEEEFKEFSDLANFSFEDYKDEEFKDNSDGTVTFTVKLSKADHEIVKGTLEGIIKDSPHKIDVTEALVQLCTDHAVEQSE